MNKPSVLIFNRVYPPGRGATGRVLRDLARGFVKQGWRVTIVTTAPEANKSYDGAVHVVRLKAVAKSKNAFFYLGVWLKFLWTGLFLPRHDLLVTMTDPPLLVVAGRIMARLKKTHHIHWCQDLYPDLLPTLGLKLPSFLMSVFKRLSRRAMKQCDKVVVVGRCMAKHLTHSGIDPGRVAVIPNWPDYELLGPDGAQREGKRKPFQALKSAKDIEGAKPYEELFCDKEPKFRVLYSGNIGRAHPIRTVLDAAQILAKDQPDIEFVFVGDGPRFDRLAQERAQRGLENIRLLPWQPASRLRELMESGDLHLITMNHETAGMLVPCKLYAALAVQRPCILVGPEDSETARVISDFKAGAVVPQGDAIQLAETIRNYRHNSKAWLAAHKGAEQASHVFVPAESIQAWIERAVNVVNAPL